ncbi:MAG: sigma-54 dependent transcriptional regulator [Thermoanaerobaculia bacterium]
MRTEAILLVDDDPAITLSLALLLKQAGYRTLTAASPTEAADLLSKGGIRLVVSDMNFSRATTGEEGLALLATIRSRWPKLPVILMTAWGSISLAVRGVRAGAQDFITKPWTHQQLLNAVRTALELSQSAEASSDEPPSRKELDARFDFAALGGVDARFLKVLDVAGRVAATDASVLITGESGTGKELVAEAIHNASPRRAGPFVKVNLGGISSQLFESEMFGHVRGAFTDARQDRKGRFEMADSGSIFLDEIGDLDLSSQVKLLRVLQDRTYEVLGSSVTRTVNVRVVSATNKNLAEAVENGRFREDLLYRLNLIALHLPPLRERAGDIEILARRFLTELGLRYGKPDLTATDDAFLWLAAQLWPGNVRQLRHLIERTVLVSGKERLDSDDFRVVAGMEPEPARKGPASGSGTLTLDEMEKVMIEKSLQTHAGNVSRVADALGLSRAALYRRLEKYGISS